MNQINAINEILRSEGFEIDFHRVWICSDCMNAILDDPEQCELIDLGTIKIEDDIAKCSIITFILGHEYRDLAI